MSGSGLATPATVESRMAPTVTPSPGPTWQIEYFSRSASTVPSAFDTIASPSPRSASAASASRAPGIS